MTLRHRPADELLRPPRLELDRIGPALGSHVHLTARELRVAEARHARFADDEDAPGLEEAHAPPPAASSASASRQSSVVLISSAETGSTGRPTRVPVSMRLVDRKASRRTQYRFPNAHRGG